MSDNKISRRFIAGAKCPQCSKEDVIYFVAEIGGDFACIECGYNTADQRKNTIALLDITADTKADITKNLDKNEKSLAQGKTTETKPDNKAK